VGDFDEKLKVLVNAPLKFYRSTWSMGTNNNWEVACDGPVSHPDQGE
jgi:hypothetical protein